MAKHALLSASSSHRWLHCPPSARLSENHEDKGSDYAAEGSEAHLLSEHKLKAALGIRSEDPTPTLTYYSEEMEECAEGYAAFILELFETAKQTCSDPQVLIEQRLDYSKYVEGGFGTGDCILIADSILHIIDFKYGQGIQVEANDNPQMKLYALGALEVFDGIYDIDTVSMIIYQPRRDNVSTHTVFKESLYQWAEEILKPTAELAFSGDGDFSCGEWCRFCKAKYDCRERAEVNLDLARFDFKLPPQLTDDEIEEILGKIDNLISWASDIKDFALHSALNGKQWRGWKLVSGRSTRKYKDETAVAETVKDAGFDPYEHKVLGVTAMTSLLGKKRFEDLLSNFIEKPDGKPTLVPESDKRPAFNTAQNDFREQ